MDKFEHYLDQVCRGVDGPKSLRQHVRQKLREHLLDAAAEHEAAGLSEEAALERALEEFGGPEEVRAGLEEAHGYRLLPVVIDNRRARRRRPWTCWPRGRPSARWGRGTGRRAWGSCGRG